MASKRKSGGLILVLFMPCLPLILILLMFAMMLGGGDSKNALAASAAAPGKVQELSALIPFGVPCDIIMMVSSYHCKTEEDANEAKFVYNAMEFLKVEETKWVFVCICEPPEPTDEDPFPEFSCSCDNWEEDSSVIYTHCGGIRGYLGKSEEDESINCINLKSALEAVAQAKSDENNKYTISSITAIDKSEYRSAIANCAIPEKDIDNILEMHEKGYFAKWLLDNGLGSGGESIIPPSVGKYIFPVDGSITSAYGMRAHPITGKVHMHTGIDIGSQHHDNIRSVAPGKVIKTGIDEYNGKFMLVSHEDEPIPFFSYYGHLSQYVAAPGQTVDTGDIIAIEGGQPGVDPDIGMSTGHHLHFEIWTSGSASAHTDPIAFLVRAGAEE